MTWVKLDDQFMRNPKVVAAGRDARDLYLAGLCYSAGNLTDGFIPENALRMLAAEADISNAKRAVTALVREGLWVQADDGFHVHDYLTYNPTRESVLATREARAEAGRRGGKQKASNLLDKTEPKNNQNSTPSTSRTQTPIVGDKSPTPPVRETNTRRNDYPPDFESFWQTYPSGHGVKKAAYQHWKRINPSPDLAQIITDSISGWRKSDKWLRGFIMDAENYLKNAAWESIPPPQSADPTANRGGGLTIHHGGRAEPIGKDGLTDTERGWRENPGHKGWSADEMMRMSLAMEQQERDERNSA